eukprot:CAMPEP_0197444704 /NCGR_PEP_ID=MMETSP1175-20131217/10127_1 /TAXON_ID=1003142 /ORGANISM="Triceratium dubium, Strain CCMP147" /LENGTH=235 /DNA_ID=CAMNT_0042975541 /DNA_START=103 /DNA_END=807 /DNA_ORIENTATION=-
MAPAEVGPVNATTYLLSVDQGSDNPPSDSSTKDDATTTQKRRHAKLSIKLLIMFHTLWGCCIIFGVYAFLFYAKTAIFHAFPAWKMTFPDLYQASSPASNWLIVVHIFLGSFLMIVSPTQYLKWIRRNHIEMHRWIGRITLIAASICATCAMIKIFLVGSAQGYHAFVGNTLLGLTVLVCAVFTYYHVAISKNIELHALWAWRFGASLVSVFLVRCLIMIILLLHTEYITTTGFL